MPKCIRPLTAKPGQLRAGWSRPEPGCPSDLCYAWGGSGAEGSEGRLLSRALDELPVFEGRSLREELERRGYDITTLKFSIDLKTS